MVGFVCGLRRAVFGEISRPSMPQAALLLLVTNHFLITSFSSDTVMVYTLGGQLVHEFGGRGSDPGRFNVPNGICVDDSGAVYVADYGNKRVQLVF